jgi:hypothetical protein
MKKRFALAVLVLFACLFAFPIPAFADTGPKPSVIVTFQGIKQKNCYVTLLAKEKSTGPHSIYNPADGQNKDTGDAPEIWQKFVDYKDADGYHFLQFYQKLGSDGVFKWGYHPPQEFKILMYSQDDNRFTVSRETYQPYAFKSYFTVDASSLNASSSGVSSVQSGMAIRAVKSYNYAGETRSLLARTAITIVDLNPDYCDMANRVASRAHGHYHRDRAAHCAPVRVPGETTARLSRARECRHAVDSERAFEHRQLQAGLAGVFADIHSAGVGGIRN